MNEVPEIYQPPITPNRFSRPSPSDAYNNSLFRRSTCSQVPVTPRGGQNESLGSAGRKGLMIAENAVFGSHQVHFDKGASKAEKVAVVAGEARTIAGQIQHAAATINVAVWAGNKLANGHLSADSFTKSFQALGSLSVAARGLSFLKATGETTFHAVKDISAHKSRGEAQALLNDYNPETRAFKHASGGNNNKARLKKLLSKNTTDLSRNKTQTVSDRLIEVKELVHKGADLASATLYLAGKTNAVAAQAAPGVGVAVAALGTVNSAIKTGIQISALNNLAKAEAATKDPLLKALSGHIRQERVTGARKHLINTAVQALSTGVGVGLLLSGVGAPAGLIAAGAIGTAVSIGTLAFDGYHSRELAKNRENTDDLLAGSRSFESLAKNNIGVAEKAFLNRLRSARGKELMESLTFLRDFGLTDNTIKKLQLAPEEKAIETLRNVLYKDKVQFKGLQLKQTVKSLARVSGFSALGRRIKAGSQWLKGKLKHRSGNTDIKPAGHSLSYAPPVTGTSGKNRPAISRLKRRPDIRPAKHLQALFTEYRFATLDADGVLITSKGRLANTNSNRNKNRNKKQ